MDRYANAIDTLIAVQERCDALVEGLHVPKKNEQDAKHEHGNGNRRSTAASVLEGVIDDFNVTPFYSTAMRKRLYVDDDVQDLLPGVIDDFKYIGNKDVKLTLQEFILSYEHLVKHEKELNEDRGIALKDLHNHVKKMDENFCSPIVFTEYDILCDDVGNPQLHKELDMAERKFIDYCAVERSMKGICGQLTELKETIHVENEKRLERMTSINSKRDKTNNRRPTDICRNNLYNLKKGVFLALDRPKRALTLQNALNDLEVVETRFAGLQDQTEKMDVEYKYYLTDAANKRKALATHQGLNIAKKMREQEVQVKAAHKKVLEGYINSISQGLITMENMQSRAKDDRDLFILRLKRVHSSITGQPIQAMNDLINTMEVAEFNEFGKLKATFLKPPAPPLSPDENEVLTRLRESVVEIFRMKKTLMDYEERVKNATLMTLIPFVSKADQIKALAKLPQTTDEMLLIETMQNKLLTNSSKLFKQYSQDMTKLVLQRCNTSRSVTVAEQTLVYGPRELDNIRFGLLHKNEFNDIKDSPSGTALMPIF